MTRTVISVEHLSKQYDLGVIGTGTLSRDLNRWWARLRKQPDPYTRIGQRDAFERLGESILALDDISFSVGEGEALGIIGRNGAGKSTLLKILSRVTAPTRGVVKVKGRIGSLLEVGTGFHPELTGRENVYLNGAILGMKKAEVARKFDEIVQFAGVERFIDTPVKRYSSGMYVRLAFAVAAHLDPDILIVDEVLAVGDAEFQKKCLGKMGDVASAGRTVLFVSHNMAAIERLCDHTIELYQGKMIFSGQTTKVVKHYLFQESTSSSETKWYEQKTVPGDLVAKLHSARVMNAEKVTCESFDISQPIFLEVDYFNLQSDLKPTAIIHIIDQKGTTLFASNDWEDQEWWEKKPEPGLIKSICKVPGLLLAEGVYTVLVAIGSYNPNIVHALERDALHFSVIDNNSLNLPTNKYAGAEWPGVIKPKLNWEVSQQSVIKR